MKNARLKNKLKINHNKGYIKKSKIKSVQKIGSDKSYIPGETLVNFIQEWLQIHKKREALTLEGKDLSDLEKERIRELDRMKVYVIDEIIFPAMANLTYFFEAMTTSSRLSIAFEGELEAMLDPRNSKQAARLSNGMRFSSIEFRENNFARLVMAMLNIPMKKYPGNGPIDDFRIGLMYQTLNVVGDGMDQLLTHEYGGNQIWKSFWDDYSRMRGWLALLTRSVKEEPKEYDRKIGFSPVSFSSKAAINEMDF
jgi:hypothetical protein